jgi:diguanylate cyclase (GGDEF)-like protein/PAS domain S-box-containing protein
MGEIQNDQNTLRAKAEAQLTKYSLQNQLLSPEALLYELQVYQIELEMQNEALRHAYVELEKSRDSYADLYNFSPVGYLTLTSEGLISKVNLTAAGFLGVARHELQYRRFSALITPEDSDRWYLFFNDVMQHNQPKTIELLLQCANGTELPVQLSCLSVTADDQEPKLLITLTDISESRRANAHLSEVELNAAISLTNAKMGSWKWNIETGRVIFNEHWARMRGYPPEEKERSFSVWEKDIHPNDYPDYHAALTAHLKNQTLFFQAEYRVRTQSDTWLWLSDRGAVIKRDSAGMPLSMAGVEMDISQRKFNEEQLRIAAIAFESQEGMFVTDSTAIIMRVNQAFTRLTGYSAAEALGQTPMLFSSDSYDAAFYQNIIDTVKTEGFWQGDVWSRRKDGIVCIIWLNISAVKTPEGYVSHYVVSFSDITSNKESDAKIHHLAYYDPLTLLPNRRLFHERLARALVNSDRCNRHGALLFIDLDNFKTLNDTLGHDMGDLLLTQVAARLLACMREGDTVARQGGDEFVVILEALSDDLNKAALQAKDVGEKIIAVLNQSYQLAHREYHSTPSIGITLFTNSRETSEDLIKRADIAMYAAKAAGRNTLRFFDPDMQARITARAKLEADLVAALENNEFRLYLQLQAHHDGRIIGAETLLRWQHPERGLVSPGEFIALAEETKLILPIGLWVLDSACALLKTWEDIPQARSLQLAVNVSAHQFHQDCFVEQVCTILEKHAVQADRLKLEITETMLLDNIDDTIIKMNALKKIGVYFSMDDFGTGYSSLSSLKKLPIDQLKIDQSFVRDIVTDPDDAIIVQTIIAMANKLGMDVIAEGVETEEQRAFLELQGCPAIQGYLFGKPVPIEQFERLLIVA